jgi:hypothetical protein
LVPTKKGHKKLESALFVTLFDPNNHSLQLTTYALWGILLRMSSLFFKPWMEEKALDKTKPLIVIFSGPPNFLCPKPMKQRFTVEGRRPFPRSGKRG